MYSKTFVLPLRNIIILHVLSSKFRWNIDEEDFQIAFFEALSRFPYLTKVMVKTGYEVESTK